MTNAKILMIRDDPPGAADLEELLQGRGYTVCATVPSGRQALE